MNTIPLPVARLHRRLGAGACVLAGACGASAATLPATTPVGVYPSYPPLDMRDPATGVPGGILAANPNSSGAVTVAIDAAVAPLRMEGGPGIAVDRLRSGPSGVATQRDGDSVVLPLCDLLARDPPDAFVLDCFGDSALHAVREAAAGRPVTGIAEWGLSRALSLGESLGTRHAGSWTIDASAEETANRAARGRLAEAGRRFAAERVAEVPGAPVGRLAPFRG